MSLHANVAVPARDRRRLERLCRYVSRPPVATERLSRFPDGRLLYRLKHRWRDGTTPVLVGEGNSAFPSDARARLELLEEHRFDNGVVYLRYRTQS